MATWRNMQELLGSAINCRIFGDAPDELRALLETFTPVVFYRNDPGLWETSCYMADARGRVVSVQANGADSIGIKVFDEHGSRQLRSAAHVEQEPPSLKLFREAVAAGDLAHVGEQSLVALWNHRGFDAARRVSQIRRLYARYGATFRPNLVIRERGNAFRWEDVLPFFEAPLRVDSHWEWRSRIPVNINLIECFGGDYEFDDETHREMREIVRQLARDGQSPYTLKEKARLKVMVSLEFEKRVFINQETFIEELLGCASLSGRQILLVVNGMTGTEDDEDEFPDLGVAERRLVDRIVARFPNVEVKYMHGKTFREKAAAYRDLDFFAASLGTAALIPQILGIAGVVYGSSPMLKNCSWFNDITESRAPLSDPDWSTVVEGDPALRHYDWCLHDGSRLSYTMDIEKLVGLCRDQMAKAGLLSFARG